MLPQTPNLDLTGTPETGRDTKKGRKWSEERGGRKEEGGKGERTGREKGTKFHSDSSFLHFQQWLYTAAHILYKLQTACRQALCKSRSSLFFDHLVL